MANDNVSPLEVVLAVVSVPSSCRIGVPAESQISMPTMVVAGMFVTVTAVVDADVAGDDAAPNVTEGAPEPDV
jgi:hypothetical protein